MKLFFSLLIIFISFNLFTNADGKLLPRFRKIDILASGMASGVKDMKKKAVNLKDNLKDKAVNLTDKALHHITSNAYDELLREKLGLQETLEESKVEIEDLDKIIEKLEIEKTHYLNIISILEKNRKKNDAFIDKMNLEAKNQKFEIDDMVEKFNDLHQENKKLEEENLELRKKIVLIENNGSFGNCMLKNCAIQDDAVKICERKFSEHCYVSDNMSECLETKCQNQYLKSIECENQHCPKGEEETDTNFSNKDKKAVKRRQTYAGRLLHV